jgi:SulP family sulfate permease
MTTGLRPNPKDLRSDSVAGLIGAVAAIPDAMASAVLCGVNPVHGLYANIVGTPVGALFTGSVFMNVSTTSAISLATGAALAGFAAEERSVALISLTVMVGLFMLVAGLLKLGFLIRFVSNAVMTGFLTGLAVLIILGQLGDFTGYSSEYSNKVIAAVDTLFHLDAINPQTLLVGVVSLLLIVTLGRTRLGDIAPLIALVIATLLVPLLGLTEVLLVGDNAAIPRSLPSLALPDLSYLPLLLVSALSIAIIGLVQAAGVSASYPNPDGKYPDISRDFSGQGAANIASGFFGGIPVGGSLSSTALVVGAGARSRWTGIIMGLIVAAAVLLFAPLVEKLPMPALAALLIVAGWQTINRERIHTVWETSSSSRLVMLLTFLLTLALPLQAAVLLGVVISAGLYVFRSAERLEVTELALLPDGRYTQQPAPKTLESEKVTVLQPNGSLFFAGAVDLGEELPAVGDARRPVAILTLRNREEVGSTFIGVIERYGRAVRANGGKLMLSGVGENVYSQLERTGALEELGPDNVYKETPIVGESTEYARRAAEAWLAAPAD